MIIEDNKTKKEIKCSVIIINYRTKELTADCIDSVFGHFRSVPFEVILIDNDSADGSVDFFRNRFGDSIELIANDHNAGFGKANNIAAQKAEGEFLFFLNSDTIITSDFFNTIFDLYKSDKELGIVAPKLLMENGLEQEYAYGKFPTFKGLFIRNSRQDSANDKSEVDWLSGAALFIKKEIFDNIGGFDDSFFMYFEDIDLCKRVKELGYKNISLSSVSLIHLGGKSAGNFSRKKMYYISQSYYFKKHFGLIPMIILNVVRWPVKIYKIFK